MSRPLFLLASLLVAAAIVASAFSVLNAGARITEGRLETYAGVERIRMDPGAGDVRIAGADVGEVEVRLRITSGLASPDVSARVAGGTLELQDACPAVVFGACSVDYELRVPRGTQVAVDASAGDVEAADLTAGVDLESSAGEVVARRVGGAQVRLASSAGDVTGEDLTARSVDATSSAGEVALDLARPPERVLADSSAGDVRVLLPGGTYAVDAETSAGDEDVAVAQDPDSEATIRVRSSAGDVTVARR